MRRSGALISLISSIFLIIISITVLVLSQIALLSDQGLIPERDVAIMSVVFSFLVLVFACLSREVKNPIAGYLCLAVSVLACFASPFVAIPFFVLSAVGALFQIIGGHIDFHNRYK